MGLPVPPAGVNFRVVVLYGGAVCVILWGSLLGYLLPNNFLG